MQIHELNNYTGDLDSGVYVAVDDGSDTGKINIPQLLADTNNEINRVESELDGRIDNIIAGGDAPSEAEIIDARRGANGIDYSSLGAAIRGQCEDLASDIAGSIVFGNEIIFTGRAETEVLAGYWHTTEGIFIDNNSIYSSSRKIPVYEGDILSVINGGTGYNWVFWDDQNKYLSYAATNTTATVPEGASFAAVDFRTDYGWTTVGIQVKKAEDIRLEAEEGLAKADWILDSLAGSRQYTPLTVTLNAYKLLNASGVVVDYAAGAQWYVSDPVDVSDYIMIQIGASSGYGNLFYAKYDADMNFIGGEASTSGDPQSYTSDIYVGEAHYVRVSRIGETRPGGVSSISIVQSSQAWSGKKWVCVGDSLTEENSATTKHYFDYISEETGITPVNFGIGGTGYTNPGSASSNFTTRMASVPTDADVYTIFGSFNDYAYMQSNSIPIGDADDTGTSTLCGYINGAFDALFARVPLANLGVIAPCPWVSINAMGSNAFGANYTEALRACCARRSVPFLDLYSESGMRPWDPNFVAQAYTKDSLSGVHPDETGHEILSTKIKAFLSELLA